MGGGGGGESAFRITWVGVSCLMSAVILSRGLHQLTCARRGCASLAKSCYHLWFSDTDEVGNRNVHLL